MGIVLRTEDQRLIVSDMNNAATLKFMQPCLQHPSYYMADDESTNNAIFHVIGYSLRPVNDVEIDK